MYIYPQKLAKLGWSPDVVMGGLWDELETHGYLPLDTDEAHDVMADYEEKIDALKI